MAGLSTFALIASLVLSALPNMAFEALPPLRVREADGSPNAIPVFDIILSNNLTLLRNNPGTVTISATTGAGGSSVVYAPTGGNYITFIADADLTNEKILTASDSITIVTDGTRVFISATTNAGGGSGTVNAGSAGNLAFYPSAGTTVDDLLIGSASTVVAVNSSGASHQYFLLRASDNMTVFYSGTAYSFSATTNNMSLKQDSITFPLIVGSGGTGQTTLTNRGILIGSGTTAVQVLTALNSGELVVGSSTIVAPQILPMSAGSQGFVLTVNTASRFGLSWVSSGDLGVASGTVNAGSQNYLTFYPSAGTTVDDTTVSISTGGGVAPFNVFILTSNAASGASGDIWFQSSNGSIYLRFNSSSTIYSVELGAI